MGLQHADDKQLFQRFLIKLSKKQQSRNIETVAFDLLFLKLMF